MLGLNGIDDRVVVEKLVDEAFAVGEFEGLDTQVEASIEFVDGVIDPAAEVPANARREDAVDNGNGRKDRQNDEQPEGNGNRAGQTVLR